MFEKMNWALVVPMANEEPDFIPFTDELKKAIDAIGSGKIYLVVDSVSKDKTRALCDRLSNEDSRFITVWSPENKNVVDAYIRGYKQAVKNDHDYVIEMDAGLSHDPKLLPEFLQKLSEGYACVFGSRFIKGGSMGNSPSNRKGLSKTGTVVANLLLGSTLHDMTSGYQGFDINTVKQFVNYPLKSKAHFYQTEIRYLLRKKRQVEIPITYNAPSPSVSRGAILNSLTSLFYYFMKRITFCPVSL